MLMTMKRTILTLTALLLAPLATLSAAEGEAIRNFMDSKRFSSFFASQVA